MTHPADKLYRFSTIEHWGKGLAEGLLFGEGGTLITLEALEALTIDTPETPITALAADPCARLLWLLADGPLMSRHDGPPVQIAGLPASVAREATRLLWGQHTAWAVSAGSIIRLDTKTGARTGSFDAADWRVIDAVQDICDGATVVECPVNDRTTARLRQIRPEGRARVLATHENLSRIIAATRWSTDSPLHLVDLLPDGVRVLTLAPDGSLESTDAYTGRTPLGPVTMNGPGRLVMAAKGGIFTVAFGLIEPLRPLTSAQPMGNIRALLWTDGTLFAATSRSLFALVEAPGTADARSARYFGPVLRSPLGDRSGWLRADLQAFLPRGAQVIIQSRAFENATAAAAYQDALHTDPDGPVVRDGWTGEGASTHFGDGSEPLRHYLGDETAEYLALRLDISVPACAAPAQLNRLDVLYPDRSLIEDLPAIYRTGTASGAQLRRILSPFQALADEIDDLIGESIRRVDSAKTDDLWTGFLLSWLGHGAFSKLPTAQRRALLTALPDILQLRGTLAGLIRVLEILAPEGFSIEDSGAAPDIWILPAAGDPAGARLGRETRAGHHKPEALILGNCSPLGSVVLRHSCLDLGAHSPCSCTITIRIYGDVRDRLDPFAERITRTFVPANTRVTFIYGTHRPPDFLERGGPGSDGLITLDKEQSRALGAWRLPRAGPGTHDQFPVLDSAVLDGTLTLE